MDLLTALLPFSILLAFWLFLKRQIGQRSKAPTRAEFEALQEQVRQLHSVIGDR